MVVAVVAFRSDYHQWYPWTLAGRITFGWRRLSVVDQVITGVAGGIGVALIGAWQVTRRETA